MRTTTLAGKSLLALGVTVVWLIASLAQPWAAQSGKHILGLHLVHPSITAEQATLSQIPDGYMILSAENANDEHHLVETKPFLTNADFANISSGFDEYTNDPIVEFELTPEAKVKFATVTRENIGNAIAIVIDGRVVSAPIIMAEISGGFGMITGGFTIKDVEDLVDRMTAAKAD